MQINITFYGFGYKDLWKYVYFMEFSASANKYQISNRFVYSNILTYINENYTFLRCIACSELNIYVHILLF